MSLERLLPSISGPTLVETRPPTKGERIERVSSRIFSLLGVLSLATLVAEFGYALPSWARLTVRIAEIFILAGFASHWTVRLVLASSRGRFFLHAWLDTLLLFLLLVQLGAVLLFGPTAGLMPVLRLPTLIRAYVVAVDLYLLATLFLAVARGNERISFLQVRPPLLVLGSFFLVILVGSLLLLMPLASADPNRPIGIIDAIFTSTSATCVTGLTVRDTGTAFSERGQWVILGLIQIGGLGVVTSLAFFTMLARRGLGVRQRVLLREVASYSLIGDMGKFLGLVVLITLLLEGLGAVALYAGWHEPGMGGMERLRWGLFHSVSAFCNAGFALKSTSLMEHATDLSVTLPILLLFMAGGIGFPVWTEILRFRWRGLRIFRRWRFRERSASPGPLARLSLHTRTVLWMSVFLWAAGAAAVWALELGGQLEGRSLLDQIQLAFFQSATCRTAGFNSLDTGSLRVATLTLLTALMVVGASPMSTGGGLKTAGIAVLFATLVAMIRNRDHVEIHRRTVPRNLVNVSVSAAVLYFLALFFFTTVLGITDPQIAYQDIFFESVSALSTVGLSAGITAELSVLGKLALCLAMLMGRTGPLVVLMSVVGRRKGAQYEYPEEEVVIT